MTDITRRGQMYRDDSMAPVGFNYKFIPSTATFANIANKPGVLFGLQFNSAVSGTFVLYDGISASGATIANLTLPLKNDNPIFKVGFSTGLYATFSSASVGNVTVSYISADK